MADIHTSFKINNIGPITNADFYFDSKDAHWAIFANNGSGKTFISRMFHLVEGGDTVINDRLLSFGQDNGSFIFRFGDTDNIEIGVKRGAVPSINAPKLIYHVFNQEYIDKNIAQLDLKEKSEKYQGYILGKSNIDLSSDKKALSEIVEKIKLLRAQVEESISQTKERYKEYPLTRLSEYKQMTFESIEHLQKYNCENSIEQIITNYKKVKSIPEEGLQDIGSVPEMQLDLQLDKLKTELAFEYSLSNFADEFKKEMLVKHVFVQEGLKLYDNNICPFCKQKVIDTQLIDQYTKYLEDKETITQRLFSNYISQIDKFLENINNTCANIEKQYLFFEKYKNDYIPSFKEVTLESVSVEELANILSTIKILCGNKKNNINASLSLDDDTISLIGKYMQDINLHIINNNKTIQSINKRKNAASNENIMIRKELCKALCDELFDNNKDKYEEIAKLREEFAKMETEISQKESQIKEGRRDKVATTVEHIINCFFNGKYVFDKDSFVLSLNNNQLDNNALGNVLSDGEKSIFAFAFYLGEAHLKVNIQADYEKLFFIIDDPISSMDFNHIYSVCGIIRDLKDLFGIDRSRYLILTHNAEFMRMLSTNNIVSKKIILHNSKFKLTNEEFTIPYEYQLRDVYQIAKGEKVPDHTTGNSVRYILETLANFYDLSKHSDNFKDYIKNAFPGDPQIYTAINDLSHGAMRSSQYSVLDDEMVVLCQKVIDHIFHQFPKQIEYCEKNPL